MNEKIIDATTTGDIKKVAMLSRCSEFDVNKGHDGFTPLQVAAMEGHTNLVKFFLQNNLISVNKVDKKENRVSALFYACDNRNVAAVKELLAFPGIDLNVHHAKDGSSPLHAVTKHEDSEIFQLLVKHANINMPLMYKKICLLSTGSQLIRNLRQSTVQKNIITIGKISGIHWGLKEKWF